MKKPGISAIMRGFPGFGANGLYPPIEPAKDGRCGINRAAARSNGFLPGGSNVN